MGFLDFLGNWAKGTVMGGNLSALGLLRGLTGGNDPLSQLTEKTAPYRIAAGLATVGAMGASGYLGAGAAEGAGGPSSLETMSRMFQSTHGLADTEMAAKGVTGTTTASSSPSFGANILSAFKRDASQALVSKLFGPQQTMDYQPPQMGRPRAAATQQSYSRVQAPAPQSLYDDPILRAYLNLR